MKMLTYKVGNSGFEIEIKEGWKVLDIGSGHRPHPRADILIDKYLLDDTERAGKAIRISTGKKFVMGDAEAMPFKDKEFEYIIASHIAEHVNDPERFCKESMRIGKRGYIETPSKFTEIILGEVFHKWYVYVKKGMLIFMRKKKLYPLGLLGNIFYSIYYVNIKREGKKTCYFQNKYIRGISNLLVYYLMRKPWRIFKSITYTCFEWEDEFNYKIINQK